MAEPELAPLLPGTEFIKNPLGVVHDVDENQIAVPLAKKGEGGWKFATPEEVKEYCKVNNIEQPARRTASDAKQATAEGDALKAEDVKVAVAAARAVDSKE